MKTETRLQFRSTEDGIVKFCPALEQIVDLPMGHIIESPMDFPTSLKPGKYTVFNGPKDTIIYGARKEIGEEPMFLRCYDLVYVGNGDESK